MNAHISGSELRDSSSGKTITLGGKNYEMVMDFNAICDLEERYGSFEKAFDAIFKKKEKGNKPEDNEVKTDDISMKDMRFMLCVMLRHTDDDMTERKAGKLITANNMQQIMNALGKAMTGSMPQPEDDEKNAENPQEK